MQVIVNDLLTNYQVIESKNGLNILFLHGWGDSIEGQRDFLNTLSGIGMVTALDLPGFGSSQMPQRAWTIFDYAKFVSEFCQKVKLGKIDLIIGHSNGGAIAIKAIASEVIKPTRAVLIGASGIRASSSTRAKALLVATKTGKAISSPFPKSIKNKLRSKVYESVGSDMLVAEHMKETFKNVVSDDLQEDAKNVNIPVLLIYGELDKSTPTKYGLIYHELMANSTFEIVGGAGHFVQQEKPEIVEQLIKDFVS
ncbi:MAG: alpha/beta hydrolase [Candidatus Saccharibacteria bacterium]